MASQQPGWYPDPADPSRNLYWDGKAWHRDGPAAEAAAPAKAALREKRHTFLWLTLGLVALIVLISQCSSTSSDTSSTKASSSATATTTTTAEEATDTRQPPTDAEVVTAFEAFIKERADSGVMLAKAVTSVTSKNGVVTVTLDANPTVLELSPFKNQAELFGTPIAFNDDDGVWLRKTVQRVDVVDPSGKSLGSLTAAELNKMGAG